MYYVILIFSVIFLGGIFTLSIYYFYHFFSSLKKSKGVPYIGSFSNHLHLLQDESIIKKYKQKNIIDLGCGDGKALRFFIKHRGIEKGIGYDINHFAIKYGTFINTLRGYPNIKLYHHDFFSQYPKEKSQYNHEPLIIYCYLYTHIISQLTKFIASQCEPGDIIIANTFPLDTPHPHIQLKQIIVDDRNKPRFYIYGLV